MTDIAETYRGIVVCEIVRNPEEVGRMMNLFHLAGAMTDQVVELRTTKDPGKAGEAVLDESFRSFSPDLLNAMNALKVVVRGKDDKAKLSRLVDLSRTVHQSPYHKAGVALDLISRGATAIIATVENPTAFRAELDVFKELDCPQKQ